MRDIVTGELPPGCDIGAIMARLAEVLDPELDESVVELGFVRSVALRSGHAEIALRLPTSWCAVNFAYLMAEDVRRTLLGVTGIRRVTVRLGDHCAAPEIEAALNEGRPFAEAFPSEGAGDLETLRTVFQRKGFLARQQRLLQALRGSGWPLSTICTLLLGDLSVEGDMISVRQGGAPAAGGPAALLRLYLERRAALGLDCASTAALIVDLDGAPFTAERLQAHYRTARTVRTALEANGLFCRALLDARRRGAAETSERTNGGESHVHA